jgi:SpoVK/Ycf46/Vps4 family AAA+-type ATPase
VRIYLEPEYPSPGVGVDGGFDRVVCSKLSRLTGSLGFAERLGCPSRQATWQTYAITLLPLLFIERGSTLLELCNQLAGVKPMPKNVLFIATTSRPDLLDETITSPRRFDWQLSIPSDTPTS